MRAVEVEAGAVPSITRDVTPLRGNYRLRTAGHSEQSLPRDLGRQAQRSHTLSHYSEGTTF